MTSRNAPVDELCQGSADGGAFSRRCFLPTTMIGADGVGPIDWQRHDIQHRFMSGLATLDDPGMLQSKG
jgi:hypothetical protein